MSKRIEYIDVAKGIGIFLVVLGHNQVKNSLPALADFIYTFHMPMFFLLSGIFFRADMGFFALLRRRFHTLLQPYLVTILAMYLTAFFFSQTSLDIILRHLAKAAYASGTYLDWAPLWFLPALFAVNIFVYLFFKAVYGRLPALWMRALVLAGMLWAGVETLNFFAEYRIHWFGREWVLNGLPFSLDLLLVIGVFFLIGYEIHRALPETFYASWWTLGVSALVLIALNLAFPFKIDLFFRVYQSFAVNSLEALAGSLFVLCLSKQIADRGGWLSRTWQYLGRVSLILLIFHGPAQTYSSYKLDDWITNPYLMGLVSFILGLGVPILIYEWLIRPNPRVAAWFGVERLSATNKGGDQTL